eukprot:766517-Hanusia_phi.AAC.1
MACRAAKRQRAMDTTGGGMYRRGGDEKEGDVRGEVIGEGDEAVTDRHERIKQKGGNGRGRKQEIKEK